VNDFSGVVAPRPLLIDNVKTLGGEPEPVGGKFLKI
jgi:hypothetical protein